tara:strand:+ start:125 stop:1789 length:1665 start_codon:yes stop_codon:yes gene_type:complete
MTINNTVIEASLQTAIDATTGASASKDLLLLSKAAEAITIAGSSATTSDYEFANNMTGRQIVQINSTGKVEPPSEIAGIAESLLVSTPYPNTGGVTASGVNYNAGVDPSNTNRFAIAAGDSTPQISVGIVASDNSVTWGAKYTGGYTTGTTGSHDVVWDPINDGILWVRSGGSSGTTLNRFSVDTDGVTLTHLGQMVLQTSYNYGTLDLHPTISNRFVMTERYTRFTRVCDLTSDTTFTVAVSIQPGAKDANSHIAKFFPDDGTKILILYGATGSGGTRAVIADLTGDTLTLGTPVQLGIDPTAYFRGKSFSWEPNGNSSTGYRFALMANGLRAPSSYQTPDVVIGTVTNVGSTGTLEVGEAQNWGDAEIKDADGVSTTPGPLSDGEVADNMCFSPYNKTDIVVGTNYISRCSLIGNEFTRGTTWVSKTISGNAVTAANGSYNTLINLGTSGKYLALMELTGGAIVNHHVLPVASTLNSEKIVGFTTTPASIGETKSVQYSGKIGGFVGLTVGSPYYVQGDASITTTKNIDSNTTVASALVGLAINQTTLLIKI